MVKPSFIMKVEVTLPENACNLKVGLDLTTDY